MKLTSPIPFTGIRKSHLVFYHLRHSCFSRLQPMLEHGSSHTALPNFYSYEKVQTQRLRKLLFKETLSNGHWEIATFAGHESSKTTFEYYFHRELALVPGRLKTKEERNYTDKFSRRLKAVYKQNRQAIQAALKYCLTHTSVKP